LEIADTISCEGVARTRSVPAGEVIDGLHELDIRTALRHGWRLGRRMGAAQFSEVFQQPHHAQRGMLREHDNGVIRTSADAREAFGQPL
jgi:hypothetical protein